MQRINWPTIRADVRRITVNFHEALTAIVTRLAQTLQFAQEELVGVAMMRFNVVSDRCRHYFAAALDTELAERIFAEVDALAGVSNVRNDTNIATRPALFATSSN